MPIKSSGPTPSLVPDAIRAASASTWASRCSSNRRLSTVSMPKTRDGPDLAEVLLEQAHPHRRGAQGGLGPGFVATHQRGDQDRHQDPEDHQEQAPARERAPPRAPAGPPMSNGQRTRPSRPARTPSRTTSDLSGEQVDHRADPLVRQGREAEAVHLAVDLPADGGGGFGRDPAGEPATGAVRAGRNPAAGRARPRAGPPACLGPTPPGHRRAAAKPRRSRPQARESNRPRRPSGARGSPARRRRSRGGR